MTIKTSADKTSKATALTRRDFLSVSAVAGTSALSSWGVQPTSVSVGNAIGLYSSSDHPLMVNVVLISSCGSAPRLVKEIRESLLGRFSNAVVVCGLRNGCFDAMVECRSEVNLASGVRTLLIHRPLIATSISRTLEQIHRDSEQFLVDGWDLYMEHASEGEHGRRRLQLALELISRTPLMAVGIVLPDRVPFDSSVIDTLSSFALEFSDISFVLLHRSSEALLSQGSERTKLGDSWRKILGQPNVYVRSESLPVIFEGFAALNGSGSHRMIWGKPHPGQSVSVGDLRMALSKLCMKRERIRAFLGLNAATVYSLCPQHYQDS